MSAREAAGYLAMTISANEDGTYKWDNAEVQRLLREVLDMLEGPAVTGGVLVEFLLERERQVAKGYTAEHDDEFGLVHLIEEALGRVVGSRTPDVATLRKALVAAGAMYVAAIEVIDRLDPK